MAKTPPMFLLSVDPGAKSAAWALFHRGVLCACGHEVTKEPSEARRPYSVVEDLQMAVSAAIDAAGIVNALALTMGPEDCVILVEKPQVYVGAKNKGDPNDLIDVALVVGAVLAAFPDGEMTGFNPETVKPAGWKGQVPKDVCKRRLQKELSTAESEIAIWSNHNVVDAIGIGCWRLGRYR